MSYLDFIILIPELFFINFILIFLWGAVYLRYKCNTSNSNRNISINFNYFSVFLAFMCLALLLNSSFINASAIHNNFIVTEFEVFLKSFTVIVFIIFNLSVLDNEKALSSLSVDIEVNTIRLVIVSSMLLLISVNDIIYLFFIMELYALSSYVLIGYRGKISIFSSESALKYFILGTIFSILMCYSFAIIYLSTGITNFYALEIYLTLSNTTAFIWQGHDIFYAAIALLLLTFFFKLGAAPLHFWAPDVYDGSPTTSTYFLFVVPKIGLLAILVKLSFLWLLTSSITNILVIAAVFSLIVGSVGGLFQKRVKRLLTYSMINNNGFFLLALMASGIYGFTFMLFFLFIYTLSLIGLFTSFHTLRVQTYLTTLKNFWSWINLFFINKIQALTTGLLLFSSAGIPPLVGFISKFFILFALLANFSNFHYLLVLALALAPLTTFYYIRIVKVMSFSKKKFWIFLKPISAVPAYIISLMTVLLFLLFLSSGFILNIILLLFI